MQLRAITMMPKKAQKHHYQTSRKAQYASLAIAVLVFAALMAYYIVVRNQPANIAFINRAFAIGAVFLIGISYILGPLARFFPKKFVKRLEYRKPLGLYGYFFAVVHILVSLMIVSGEELGGNGLSLIFGMLSILVFTLVASTSIIKIDAHGFERWQKIQRLGYLAFVLVILHFTVLQNGAFISRQLGQLTIGFALLVILARLATLLPRKRNKGRK